MIGIEVHDTLRFFLLVTTQQQTLRKVHKGERIHVEDVVYECGYD